MSFPDHRSHVYSLRVELRLSAAVIGLQLVAHKDLTVAPLPPAYGIPRNSISAMLADHHGTIGNARSAPALPACPVQKYRWK